MTDAERKLLETIARVLLAHLDHENTETTWGDLDKLSHDLARFLAARKRMEGK